MSRAATMSPSEARLMTRAATCSPYLPIKVSIASVILFRDPAGRPRSPFSKGRPRVFPAYLRGPELSVSSLIIVKMASPKSSSGPPASGHTPAKVQNGVRFLLHHSSKSGVPDLGERLAVQGRLLFGEILPTLGLRNRSTLALGSAILVFNRTDDGNVKPKRVIQGPATKLLRIIRA
jgi:hypothetical protein